MTGDRAMAILLARIDARMGAWVQLHDLAEHLDCTDEITCGLLERAEAIGLVRLARGLGDRPECSGVFAATSAVRPAALC